MTDEWTLLVTMLPDLATKIGAAVLCGMILGIERELKDKPAGLRTIMLITVGATVFMIVSELIPIVVQGESPVDITRVDPSRIASQVVSGIGFLGAGAIIQARGAVHGLTTAAVIWVAAGIGLCVGIGFPLLGIGMSLVVLLVLTLMDPLGDWLNRRKVNGALVLLVPDDQLTLQRVEYALEQHGIPLTRQDVSRQDEHTLRVTIHLKSSASGHRLLDAIARIEGVRGVPYEGGGNVQ